MCNYYMGKRGRIKMYQMPIIRLEIQHMKQTMQVALADYHLKISEEVDIQLANVIENYPFEEVVQKAAYDALTGAIGSYFKYGDGYKLVQKALKDTFADIVSGLGE